MLRSTIFAIVLTLAAATPALAADPSPASVPAASPATAVSPEPTGIGELSAHRFEVFADSPITTVSLGLYSGLPDPTWELTDDEATTLTALLEALPQVDGFPPPSSLGYHGFWIERLTPDGMPRPLIAFEGTVSDPFLSYLSYLADPERSVERFLLDSGQDQLSADEITAVGLDPQPTSSPGS